MTPTPRRWPIRCRDVWGRPAILVVLVDPDNGRLALQAPPGEYVTFCTTAAGALHQALLDARVAAARIGWTAWPAPAPTQ